MIPRSFEYFCPTTLKEAASLLDKKEDAKVLAGGLSLVPLMKLRLASPKSIVDITRIPNFSYIKEEKDGSIAIGALTTHDTVENSPVIKDKCYVLSEAASRVGDQQIRNRGTIAGTLCHADPSADIPVALTALEAQIAAFGPKGEKVIPANNFFLDFFDTALDTNQIVTEVRIPALPPNSASAYMKHARREGDFAIASAAVVLTMGKDNVCRRARIALGSAGSTPVRAQEAEKALTGKTLTDDVIKDAAEKAKIGVSPPSDIHGSAEYRTEMIGVFTKRTINLALSRFKGG